MKCSVSGHNIFIEKFWMHSFLFTYTHFWLEILMKLYHIFKCVAGSVADPDPGSIAFLSSGSGVRDGKNPDLGSGMNIPDHFSESLETVFGVPDPGSKMEKFGSGIRYTH